MCMLSCFSHFWLFMTQWNVAHQAHLSIGFSRQEYWNKLPCPPPGVLPNPGIKLTSLNSPVLAGVFFTSSATWESLQLLCSFLLFCILLVDNLFSVVRRNIEGRVQTCICGHEAIGILCFLLSCYWIITWVGSSFFCKWRIYVIYFSPIPRNRWFSIEKLTCLLWVISLIICNYPTRNLQMCSPKFWWNKVCYFHEDSKKHQHHTMVER